ncbi:MAG: hypothetical protein WCK90_00405 [archaeon]
MIKIKKQIMLLMFGILLISLASLSMVSAEVNVTVCCERTTSGLYCQDVVASQCASGVKQAPTACVSTSYCKPGTCYGANDGTCTDNTPQMVCNNKKGTWSVNSPPQCELGCCLLGDQAAFVSLVRCKNLSSALGLQTNYRKDITDEVSCVLQTQNSEKGACVYESEFQKSCRITSRGECAKTSSANANGTSESGTFFKDKLCSAPELGTICGPSSQTTCADGQDGVYFLDTCGNVANIYDSAMAPGRADTAGKDFLDYWANMKDRSEVCGAGSANAGSASCGNCNYLLGSYCRPSKSVGASATVGEYICADLNCKKTQDGTAKKHGESWCVWNDAGNTGKGQNSVGSRFFKHVCVNGQEIVEPCADYRQEECIQDTIRTAGGAFSQAACRVNRWQDCVAQTDAIDCGNTDKRDCLWREGVTLGTITNTSQTQEQNGTCLPKNPPGLKFWEGEQTKQICAQANTQCTVVFQKGLFGKETCKENCECLTDAWVKQKSELCMNLGDCGPNVNWLGTKGNRLGYKVTTVDSAAAPAASSTSGTTAGTGLGSTLGAPLGGTTGATS